MVLFLCVCSLSWKFSFREQSRRRPCLISGHARLEGHYLRSQTSLHRLKSVPIHETLKDTQNVNGKCVLVISQLRVCPGSRLCVLVYIPPCILYCCGCCFLDQTLSPELENLLTTQQYKDFKFCILLTFLQEVFFTYFVI